jgi:hypothetical protein
MTRTRFLLTSLVAIVVLVSASTALAQNKAPDGAILISQTTVLGGLAGDGFGLPITITQPGLYRLTSNIVVPDANTTAIQIIASHVTLDLNGFSILGPTVCIFEGGSPWVTSCSPTGTGIGVSSDANAIGVAVRNGNVSGMGSRGIELNGLGGRVEGITASHNGFNAIRTGFASINSSNIAILNRSGITASGAAVLVGNTATLNTLLGFNVGTDTGAAFNVSIQNGPPDNLTPGLDVGGNVCGLNTLCP